MATPSPKIHFVPAALAVALVFIAARVGATPSTQIWIPSTDTQKFATVHLNYDVYARILDEPSGLRKPTLLVLGPTVGVLPFEKVGLEVGADVILASDPALDRNPLYFHAKLASPEDAFFKRSPAVAVGIYNVGTNRALTMQNVSYGLVARTLPFVGRLSAGYYYANARVVVDENGAPANHGLLLSWDRTLTELSDRLWLCVDYQGGQSALGALNFGFSWAFSPSTSVLVAYDRYLNRPVAGADTFTVQLDINI